MQAAVIRGRRRRGSGRLGSEQLLGTSTIAAATTIGGTGVQAAVEGR